MDEVGYFLFSFDTELATGRFDLDQQRSRMFSADGSSERQAIFRLIELCEEYEIVGSWAVVGHLFYDKCDNCGVCKLLDWKGKYSSFEEVHGTRNPLWYGSDIIEALLTRGPRQEIGFHGFSHRIFDETHMSVQDAAMEVSEWLRIASKKAIVPHAVVFPRNLVGHLAILREAGFVCYRCEPNRNWLIRNKIFGRYIKAIDQVLGLSHLPIYQLENTKDHGMVTLYSSQCFFDLNRKFEHFLDRLNLHNLRFRRVIRGIKAAAEEKKMVHLWAHPCDFRSEKDFIKLRYVLKAVSEEVKMGRMKSVGMTEMAKLIIAKNTAPEYQSFEAEKKVEFS
jgi:hypothetical protein